MRPLAALSSQSISTVSPAEDNDPSTPGFFFFYIHAYILAYVLTYLLNCLHTCIHADKHTCVHTCMHTYLNICTFTRTYYIHTHLYLKGVFSSHTSLSSLLSIPCICISRRELSGSNAEVARRIGTAGDEASAEVARQS